MATLARELKVEELKALAEELRMLDDEAKTMKAELEEKHKEIARKEMKCVEYLNELGLDTFETPLVKLTPGERSSYKLPSSPEEKEALFNHLRNKGLFEGMVSINYNTLNSWAKEEYDNAKKKGDIFFTIPGLGAPTISPKLYMTKRKLKTGDSK